MQRFFTLAAYIFLVMAFFGAIVTATSVAILPGIAITFSVLLMDLATWNSKSTLIYALAGVFTAPVLALYTWIQGQLSPNLQKELNTNSSIGAENYIVKSVKSIQTKGKNTLDYPPLSFFGTKDLDTDENNENNCSANLCNKLY